MLPLECIDISLFIVGLVNFCTACQPAFYVMFTHNCGVLCSTKWPPSRVARIYHEKLLPQVVTGQDHIPLFYLAWSGNGPRWWCRPHLSKRCMLRKEGEYIMSERLGGSSNWGKCIRSLLATYIRPMVCLSLCQAVWLQLSMISGFPGLLYLIHQLGMLMIEYEALKMQSICFPAEQWIHSWYFKTWES